MSSFKKNYPDFASIEHHVRQAHAERSVYIATLVADAIVGVVSGAGRLIAGKPAAKPSAPRETARV